MGKGWPANRKVAGDILSQGTHLGCRPGPQLGVCERQSRNVSLPLSPAFPLSLKSLILKSPGKKILDINQCHRNTHPRTRFNCTIREKTAQRGRQLRLGLRVRGTRSESGLATSRHVNLSKLFIISEPHFICRTRIVILTSRF